MSADKILSIKKTSTAVLIFFILFLAHIQVQAAIVEYDLTIAQMVGEFRFASKMNIEITR